MKAEGLSREIALQCSPNEPQPIPLGPLELKDSCKTGPGNLGQFQKWLPAAAHVASQFDFKPVAGPSPSSLELGLGLILGGKFW